MRALLVALGLWSGAALLILFLDPGGGAQALLCGRLVGHGSECDAAQAASNEIWWRLHTLPMLLLIATGYVAIALVRARSLRLRARRP